MTGTEPEPEPVSGTAAPTLLTHDWSMGYPMTLRSVRPARLHTRRRLTMWRWAGDIDDAVLAVSELTANAARHARTSGHELWLRLAETEAGELIVDVSDPVPALPSFSRGRAPADAVGEHGRGLLVVTALAVEFTWFLRPTLGKTVRARLAAGASGAAPV